MTVFSSVSGYRHGRASPCAREGGREGAPSAITAVMDPHLAGLRVLADAFFNEVEAATLEVGGSDTD